MNNQSRTFEIPSSNFAKFQERWDKLVRRAHKLGIEPPAFVVLSEEIRPKKVQRQRWNEHESEYETYWEDVAIVYKMVQLQNPIVQVAGWQFAATLEHLGEDGNITHNISGSDLPIRYRNCGPACDHCQTKRYRKDTFVVFSPEKNEYKQVGSSCLTDFLGVDGSRFAAMAEIYSTATELASASEQSSGGNCGDFFDYLDVYLSYVAETIGVSGWLSRKAARELDKPATSDVAYRHLHPNIYDRQSDRLFDKPSEKAIDLAKDSIAWCESLSDAEVEASEYLHNIRVIARRGIVGGRQYGYAASIVSSFQRALVDKANKERESRIRNTSEYVGEVGKRVVFNLMVEKVLEFDGMYGTTLIHLMSDNLGNRFVWKSSGKAFEIGIPIRIKATVKKHGEYKGTKQTELTRCSLA